MISYVFPDLDKWFYAEPYREHNGCQLLEIRMLDGLTKTDIDVFCLEFAKYICSIRCQKEDLFNKMVDAMEKGVPIDDQSKDKLRDIFFNGFIKDELFKQTNDYRNSFDNDNVKGYLGEAFYYLIRNQFVIDDKVSIIPQRPKKISKTPGIDFIEVRKDNNGYYFVIGEIKTTSNSYSARNNEVIDAFLNRINKNFSETYQELADMDDGTDPGYTLFLKEMLDIFYGFKDDDRKRLAGVFNYGYNGRKVPSDAFSTWKNQPFKVKNDSICRRIKVIGIYDIDNVLFQVRDNLWNVL